MRINWIKRPWKVLIWGVVFFFLFQIGGGLCLDYFRPMLKFPEAQVVFDRLGGETIAPGVVFLGSSRTQGGIRPEVIAPLVEKDCRLSSRLGVFNAAVPAGDPITYEFMFDHLVREGVRPEYVVIEVNPESINRRNEWLSFHFKRQLNWSHLLTHGLPAIRSGAGQRLLASRLFPVFLHRDQILARIKNLAEDKQNSHPFNWKTNPVPDNPDRSGTVPWDSLLVEPESVVTSELKARIELSTEVQPRRWLRTYETSHSLTKDALERTLKKCNQMGISVILVSVPVTQLHRNTYKPEIEREFRIAINDLQKKYHVAWVDTRDWVSDGLFEDNHHLTGQGGVYYSKLVARYVLAQVFSGNYEKMVANTLGNNSFIASKNQTASVTR